MSDSTDAFTIYMQAHMWPEDSLEHVLERIETARKVLDDAELVIDARQNPDTPDDEQRGGLSIPQPGAGHEVTRP